MNTYEVDGRIVESTDDGAGELIAGVKGTEEEGVGIIVSIVVGI